MPSKRAGSSARRMATTHQGPVSSANALEAGGVVCAMVTMGSDCSSPSGANALEAGGVVCAGYTDPASRQWMRVLMPSKRAGSSARNGILSLDDTAEMC